MHWLAQAPSNIALVKYMGKRFYSPFPSLISKKGGLTGADSIAPSVRSGRGAFTEGLSPPSLKPAFAPCFLKGLSDKEQAFLRFSNLSLNPSLSYTLKHFQAVVRVEEAVRDEWRPFAQDPFHDRRLFHSSQKIDFAKRPSPKAQKRFMTFFALLKRFFSLPGHYAVFSENNFPLGAGLASSAAGFSALTLAALRVALDRSPFQKELGALSQKDLSCLSRAGSGSSCRSFLSPWALWEGRGAKAFKAPWPRLLHQLVLTDPRPKSTSSTAAHQRVASSPLFEGRAQRATARLRSLREAFGRRDWQKAFRICREEFLDMHSLFSSASPSFSYTSPAVEKALAVLMDFWKKEGDGPWITMDAGANIHLLYRPDQKAQSDRIKTLLMAYPILSPAEV